MILRSVEGQGPWGVLTICRNCGHDDPMHAYRSCAPADGEQCGCTRFHPIEDPFPVRRNPAAP